MVVGLRCKLEVKSNGKGFVRVLITMFVVERLVLAMVQALSLIVELVV